MQMVGDLIFLLSGELILGLALFIMCITRFSIWRIQLIVKERFPRLPDVLCRLCFFATILLIIWVIVQMMIFVAYFAPHRMNISGGSQFFFLTYTLMIFSISFQHFYLPMRKWQLSGFYLFVVYATIIMYFVMQFVACSFSEDFNENGYTAIYLEISFFFYSLGIQHLFIKGSIDVREFCHKFIEYLETVTKDEGVRQAQHLEIEMPPIPNEHFRELERSGEVADKVDVTIQPLPSILHAFDLSNRHCKVDRQEASPDVLRQTPPQAENLISPIVNKKADIASILNHVKEDPVFCYVMTAVNIGTFSTFIAYSVSFL